MLEPSRGHQSYVDSHNRYMYTRVFSEVLTMKCAVHSLFRSHNVRRTQQRRALTVHESGQHENTLSFTVH